VVLVRKFSKRTRGKTEENFRTTTLVDGRLTRNARLRPMTDRLSGCRGRTAGNSGKDVLVKPRRFAI
jgi:hypothetical protein